MSPLLLWSLPLVRLVLPGRSLILWRLLSLVWLLAVWRLLSLWWLLALASRPLLCRPLRSMRGRLLLALLSRRVGSALSLRRR